MDLQSDRYDVTTAAELDRRRFPRHSVNVQIEIRAEGSDVPLRLETTDLSRGGCYLQMFMPLPVNQRVRATLWLGGDAIIVRGVVVTCHPSFGSGIMFVAFEGAGKTLLNLYIDKLIGIETPLSPLHPQ